MSLKDPSADTTSPEVRAMVDRTVSLLKHQVGALRSRTRVPSLATPAAINSRIEAIRRQALAVSPHPPAAQSNHASQPLGD